MTQLSVKVIRKTQEAADIVSLELAALDGSALPPFSAGAHIDVHVRDGLVRHRQSRGGSVAMHDAIREGEVIRISAPKNHFPLVPAGRSLLFAGGIGVTPILCMAERLAHAGANFEMHYCTRELARTAFH